MLESAWESEWRIVDCRSSFIHEIQDSEGEFESRAQLLIKMMLADVSGRSEVQEHRRGCIGV
jgi:hypothetical protein